MAVLARSSSGPAVPEPQPNGLRILARLIARQILASRDGTPNSAAAAAPPVRGVRQRRGDSGSIRTLARRGRDEEDVAAPSN